MENNSYIACLLKMIESKQNLTSFEKQHITDFLSFNF